MYKNGFISSKYKITLVAEWVIALINRQRRLDIRFHNMVANSSDDNKFHSPDHQHYHDHKMYIFIQYTAKQYIYNTLKLFLFLEMFTVLGQFIVLFHPVMKPTQQEYYSDPQTINQIIEQIIEDNPARMLACSI